MLSRSKVESVELNGTELFFSINSEAVDKPVILYVHGGPGDACVPLTKKYNSELEDDFTFVNLEQRGSGLSYYPFPESEKGQLVIEDMVEDIYLFTLYLLERLNQKKLILMGHSWGSVLGLLFIQKYPEFVSYYVGIGQVVNMKKNIEYQRAFLKDKMPQNDFIDQLDLEGNLFDSSLILTKKIVSFGGSVYGAKNYRQLTLPFIFSKDYSLRNLIHRIKGSNQSIHYFWMELLDIDFESCRRFEVPILFCEGKNDYHVSSDLVSKYAKTIETENDIIWFEKSAHFPQWEESGKFNRVIKELFAK